MKTTVNLYEFRRAFETCRPANFSYSGLDLLFDYFEQLGDDIGEEIELDVIAICCEYSEDSWQDWAGSYDIDLAGCDDDDERRETVIEYWQENTSYVGATGDELIAASF